MKKIYLIIKGLRTCHDDDSLLGFYETMEEAQKAVDEMNAILGSASSYEYYVEPIENWSK